MLRSGRGEEGRRRFKTVTIQGLETMERGVKLLGRHALECEESVVDKERVSEARVVGSGRGNGEEVRVRNGAVSGVIARRGRGVEAWSIV